MNFARPILIIAPHADDEVLGCGGVIAKVAEEGGTTVVAVLTNASVGAPELFSESAVEVVRTEASAAHLALGVTESVFLDLPAPQLDQYPQYKVANIICELIKKFQPGTVLTPHRGDLHLDHGAIFNATLVAARPQGRMTINTVMAYETLSETNWGHPYPDAAFIPNFYIRLSELQMKRKLEAMAQYRSQLKEFPHPRSLHALKSLGALRGASVGAPAAEAFVIVRDII